MMKILIPLALFSIVISTNVYSQLMVSKQVGKNTANAKLGFGLFTYFDFPLHNSDNQSIRLELLDAAFYPRKNNKIDNTIGYLSIKAGYKYVFSETQTGVYVEPQAGYCRVVVSNDANPSMSSYGDGFALALETGYSLGVGENGNTINLGLKYETDRAGAAYIANSVGFRVSYSFHMFGRKDR